MKSNIDSFFKEIKNKFPIFNKKINGKEIIFLDTAASSQKPQSVIDSVSICYSENYANIHRGVYYLSSKLTRDYELVRENIASFINAKNEKEIIFTKSATEGLNLLANCFCDKFLNEGDEILISHLEHHANIVPWQIQSSKKNIKIKVADLNNDTSININDLLNKISEKTKLISITHVSNSLGHITDLKTIITHAKKLNIPVIVDGCQYIAHSKLDVQSLDCDFYVFSGHKIYGPSGIGILYGKQEWLEKFPPYQGGGDMIDSVSFEKTVYADSPQKFEAGTPPIAQVIGLGSAINFVREIGIENITAYEHELTNYAYDSLKQISSIDIIGNKKNNSGIISFNMKNTHHNDLGTLLDQDGISVRTGHHCTQPLMKKLGITGTARVSFGVYNNKNDIDQLVTSLNKINNFFK